MDSARTLYGIAQEYLPGGVCASYRVNEAIGRPFYVSRGDGAYVYDLDGREYVDLCMSHGASLLGHNHAGVKAAVAKALELGVICAYETEFQSALARRITELVPGAEMVRFAGSGTETVMHALRLARTATGRDIVLKFEGHFHGYSDYVAYSYGPPLDEAGPADRPVAYPQSAGMPRDLADLIIVVPFNDPDALVAAFDAHGDEIACLIMEPISYDMGCVLARPGLVQLCRELCDRHGALLFFDEVLTAFRMAPGGAQQYLGVTADLCVLGKALGGGMPISAITGPRELMRHLRPLGDGVGGQEAHNERAAQSGSISHQHITDVCDGMAHRRSRVDRSCCSCLCSHNLAIAHEVNGAGGAGNHCSGHYSAGIRRFHGWHSKSGNGWADRYGAYAHLDWRPPDLSHGAGR